MSLEDYKLWRSTKITTKPYLSVVIPTYNEEWRIIPTIGAIASFVSSLGFAWELIISDDGSSDTTTELVKDLNLANLTLLESPNTGKGGAVRRGVMKAEGELILFADADQSTPIEQLPEFIEQIEIHGADIAIGSRNSEASEVENKSLPRKILSQGLQAFVRLGFRLPHKDTQCGFKLFKANPGKGVFSVAKIDGFSFDLELLYIAKQAGLKTSEIPVQWFDAPGSTVSGGSEAIKFILDMPKVLMNDFRGKYKIKNSDNESASQLVEEPEKVVKERETTGA